MHISKLLFTVIIALSFYACESEIPSADTEGKLKSEAQPQRTEGEVIISGSHEIVALEVLNSRSYVYVKAKEGEKEYWLAATKMPVEVGSTYFYSGGMIANDFKSKEHNRVFDELFLVNKLTPEKGQMAKTPTEASPEKVNRYGTIELRENGSVPIGDIVENASVFEGKKVRVQGKCTKVNLAIMNKNWVHLDDGSNNGYDFIVTTEASVALGDELIMEGILVLDKDLGAGYVYPILLENCELIQ